MVFSLQYIYICIYILRICIYVMFASIKQTYIFYFVIFILQMHFTRRLGTPFEKTEGPSALQPTIESHFTKFLHVHCELELNEDK